jgi:hypothetical protein
MNAKLLVPLTAAAIALLCAPAFAEWSHDPTEGNPVSVVAGSGQDECVSVPDGSGGVFVVWVDDRNGDDDVFAQHLDHDGNPLWTANGVAVCDTIADQNELVATPDGEGGLVVAWTDSRGADTDIYAQRLDSDGVALWVAGGRAVSTAAGDQSMPNVAASVDGGAVLAWLDGRNEPDLSVFAQRLAPIGAFIWSPVGVRLGASNDIARRPGLVWDDSFGVFAAWEDGAITDETLRMQRLDVDGNPLWASEGYAASSHFTVTVRELLKDGDDGVIAVWTSGSLVGGSSIGASRVTGDTLTLWQVTVRSNAVDEYTGSVGAAPGGFGGVIIGWSDTRSGDYDVYAQLLDGGGSKLWLDGGAPLCVRSGNQSGVKLETDGADGAIIVWEDDRFGFMDIYAQRVDSSGAAEWLENGVEVSTAPLHQSAPSVAVSTTGNAVVVWSDERSGDSDIYAQLVERNGFLGDPAPAITDVADFPNDQGGQVVLSWAPSYLDEWPEDTVDYYSVWRRLNDGSRSLGGMPSAAELELGVEEALARHGWEFVLDVEATQLEEYASTVPTYGDSSASGIVYTDLMVWAEDYYLDESWMSGHVTTYSIDNIYPGAPLALTAEELQLDVGLIWSPSRLFDEDLSHYDVHRSDESGFVPNETTLVGTTEDTVYMDIDPGRAVFYYVVTAEDVNGNVGPPSNEAWVETWTGAGELLPVAYALRDARPNPFNPLTTIAFDVPEPGGHVTLEVFDIGGRSVRSLESGFVEPGQRSVVWDGTGGSGRRLPSGVYFCRMKAEGYERTIKLTLLK